MLVRYKKSYQKIAMGLLSYMPDEKELRTLKGTIDCYESKAERQLYLWKVEDDIVGVIGTEADEGVVKILHVAVNPSYRDEGIGTQMIEAITSLYAGQQVLPNEATNGFYEKCMKQQSR